MLKSNSDQFYQAIPPFLFPHHKRQWSSRLVETLQTSSILLYVVALFVILGRANHISWPPPSTKDLSPGKEAMGTSPWGGISILIFCFSSHQSTFAFQRSLKPPKSLTLPSHQTRNGFIRRGRHYSWELTAFSGMLGAAVVCLGWGLVGYLAIPYPHRGPINIFNALPDHDRWFAFARLLVLTTMLCGLGSIVRPASSATKRLMEWPLRVYRQQEDVYEQRIRDAESSDDSDSDAGQSMPAVRNKRQHKHKIRALKRTSVLTAWVIATVLAMLFGGNSRTLASMVEVIGCIGSSVQAFIVPGEYIWNSGTGPQADLRASHSTRLYRSLPHSQSKVHHRSVCNGSCVAAQRGHCRRQRRCRRRRLGRGGRHALQEGAAAPAQAQRAPHMARHWRLRAPRSRRLCRLVQGHLCLGFVLRPDVHYLCRS